MTTNEYHASEGLTFGPLNMRVDLLQLALLDGKRCPRCGSDELNFFLEFYPREYDPVDLRAAIRAGCFEFGGKYLIVCEDCDHEEQDFIFGEGGRDLSADDGYLDLTGGNKEDTFDLDWELTDNLDLDDGDDFLELK